MPGPQKFLTDKTMRYVLALTSAFPPLSTDLYLPALPGMVTEFGTTQAQVNLTLSLFFICFAAAILFWGPMSDKYGRKPVLSTGLVIYILSSAGCAMATDITLLIVFRVCQAFGGGAATAVSTAVVKDHYTGKQREITLAVIMTMVIAAPVVAPLVGAFLLKFYSWRSVFWVLAGIGTLALVLSGLLQETLDKDQRYTGSPLASVGRLVVVLRNPGFSFLFLIFSLLAMPMLGFIAASSFIYIQGFGLSEQVFSFFFSFNALCAMAGPMFCIRITRRFGPNVLITACYGFLAVTGLLVMMVGGLSPYILALLVGPATFFILACRPPSASLMLEQQDRDTGSASALINSGNMMMGSLGMFILSTDVEVLIPTLGLMQLAVGVVGGGLWLMVRKRKFIRQVPET
ncbi:MAG: multidrug effflux MFS transporter [Desulfobacterales bacterium]|nr:multidrug effflux MFS transporter [Desulfobacterales bacterium]